MNSFVSDDLAVKAVTGTKRSLSGKRRSSYGALPQFSRQFPTSRPQTATSSLQVNVNEQSPVTIEIYRHIDAIKHLDDTLIVELLRSARFYSSSSIDPTAGDSSRRPSQVPSLISDTGSITSSPGNLFSFYNHSPSPSVPTLPFPSRARPCMPQRSVSEGQVLRVQDTPSMSSVDLEALNQHHPALMQKPLPDAPARQTFEHPKNYVCTFCEETFKTKAYWKTHEEEMHEQPKRWTCPDCYRTFHAEKKYRRHHAESHGCKDCGMSKQTEKVHGKSSRKCAERVVLQLHKKQAYGCGFCVTLLTSWSERCEHVASHFERGRPKSDWSFSNIIKSLLLQSELAIAWEALLTKEHGADKAQWPWFSWRKKESRDLLRAMEQHGMVHEKAKQLARSAYDLGRIDDTWMDEHMPSTGETRISKAPTIATQQQPPTSHSRPATPALSVAERIPTTTPPRASTPFHGRTPSIESPKTRRSLSPATKELLLLIDQEFPSGTFLDGFDPLDFRTPKIGVHNPDIVTFNHPGAYTAFTSAAKRRNSPRSWLRNASPDCCGGSPLFGGVVRD